MQSAAARRATVYAANTVCCCCVIVLTFFCSHLLWMPRVYILMILFVVVAVVCDVAVNFPALMVLETSCLKDWG